MKKITITFMLILAALLLMASCEESSSVADMRIVIDSDTSRLIAPEGFPLEVKSYHITGRGPNGDSFSFTTKKSSTTLSGVAVGEWIINATGLNEESTAIVTGSTTFTLSVNNPSVVVRLDSLVGNGNLSISMSWNKDVINNPRIELELTKQNEEQSENLETTMNTSEGTATASKTNLEAGSYILQGRLYSSDILMSGFTEAVRIVGDQTSSSEIEFNLDAFPYAPGSIQLLDQSGIPVECTVEGLSSEVTSDEEIEISLVPERSNLKDITVKWYVDGVLAGSGVNVNLSFTPGMHRLDAVAYTSKIGSYGSCSIAFNALVKTERGVPGNSITIDAATTGLKLGTNTVVKFLPDGKLMVASGLNNTIQIASMLRNSVEIEKEYGISTIPSLSGEPVDLDYVLLDGSGTYAVLVAYNGSGNTARLNYLAPTMELSQIETCDGYRTSFMGNSDKFTTAHGDIGFDEMMKEFVLLAYDADGKTTYLLERYVPSTTADVDFAYRGIDVTSQIEDNLSKPSGSFDTLNSLGVSIDGSFYLVGNANGNIARLNHKTYAGGNAQKNGYKLPNLTSDYTGLKKIEFSDYNSIGYLMGTDFIAAYNGNLDREVFFKRISGENFVDFAINDETGNIYLLSENMRIYSYKLLGDGNVSEEVIVDTQNISNNIELSVDGSYLVLYSKAAANQIEVMRIKTTE